MILKPQDIVVLLKLVSIGQVEWSYNKIALALNMSPSEIHAAIKRTTSAQLSVRYHNQTKPNIRNLKEFLVHGLKYVFVPERGEMTRGITTAYAAPPLLDQLVSSDEPPPVWPDPDGDTRGLAFSPLYPSVPQAARKDHRLYELLVLVDGIRGGHAREHQIAVLEIQRRLDLYDDADKS